MAASEQVASTDSVAMVEDSPMSSLSDDELLSVLRWLDAAELLAARAVCRRWRALALHPDLWRQRRITDECPRSLRRAVLRLAPCAASFHLKCESLVRLGAVLASTRCAVAELKIIVDKKDSNVVLAAMAIHCQVGLGRLRKLSVKVNMWGENVKPCPALVDLLAEVHRAEGLTELKVSLDGPSLSLPGWAGSAVPAEPLPASLKKLRYQAGKLFPHAAFQLRSHAATLTEVSLLGVVWEERWPPGPLVELLQDIPGLRTLHCQLPDDMRPLLQLSQLRSLRLEPGFSDEDASSASVCEALENANSFFRKATELRQLRLVEWPHSAAAGLVAALASSGRSQLRRLTLAGVEALPSSELDVDDYRNMNLPGLPSLRDIYFLAEDDDLMALLKVLGAVSVPSLRVVDGFAERCAHELVHEPVLAAAIRRNPGLHVLTSNLCCEETCAVCNEHFDCELGYQFGVDGVGICGHTEADDGDCGVAEHKDSWYDLWVRVRVRSEQD